MEVTQKHKQHILRATPTGLEPTKTLFATKTNFKRTPKRKQTPSKVVVCSKPVAVT